jgi:hypothetical protein
MSGRSAHLPRGGGGGGGFDQERFETTACESYGMVNTENLPDLLSKQKTKPLHTNKGVGGLIRNHCLQELWHGEH